MRSTLYNIPNNQDVLKASGVPFAVSITPLTESLREEVSELFVAISYDQSQMLPKYPCV